MKKSNIVSSILQQSKTFIHVWKYRKSNTKPRPNPSNKLDRMMRVSKIPFLREELILLRNLFHSCLNPCCMQKKFPSLRFPFRYISTNPPEIPSFAFTGAKFLIIFSLRGNRPVLEDVNSRCKFYAPHDAPCKSDSSSRVPSIQFFNFYTPLLKLEHRL